MGPIFGLTLIVLITSVGSVGAACRRTDSDVLIEYYCVGGQLSDLNAVPERAEKIRIMNMPIRRITANTFSRFGANLLVLGCSYCSVTDIEPNAFEALPNLEQLSLNNNYLTSVKESWCRHLRTLTFLDLNYNRIRNVEDGVFENLRELVDFRISGNQLECLNLHDMSHLSELRRIFLNENPEFKCPNAMSAFLSERNVGFDKDPEWSRMPVDSVSAEIPINYGDHRWKTPSTERPTPPPFRESQWTTHAPPPQHTPMPPLLAPSPMDHRETPIFVESNMERTTGTYELYPRLNGEEDTPPSNYQNEPHEESVSPTSESSMTTYVRPVPPAEPEWLQPVDPGDMFHAPYYEPTVTTRPPANIQQRTKEETANVSPIETTTDKPLPQCPNASSSLTLYLWTILLAALVVANNVLLKEI